MLCRTADKSTHAVSFLLEATRGIGRKRNLVQEQLLSFLLFKFLFFLSQLALKKKKKKTLLSLKTSERSSTADAFCFVAKQGVKRLNPNWTEREITMPVLNQDVVDPQQQHQCGIGANQVTHVIFDVDGTLLDTGPLYNKAITKVCNHHSLISALFVQTVKRGIILRFPKGQMLWCRFGELRRYPFSSYFVRDINSKLSQAVSSCVPHLRWSHPMELPVLGSSHRCSGHNLQVTKLEPRVTELKN